MTKTPFTRRQIAAIALCEALLEDDEAARAYAVVHGNGALEELGQVAAGERPAQDDQFVTVEEFMDSLAGLDLSFLADEEPA